MKYLLLSKVYQKGHFTDLHRESKCFREFCEIVFIMKKNKTQNKSAIRNMNKVQFLPLFTQQAQKVK